MPKRANTEPLRWTTSVNRAAVVEYDDRIVVKVHDQSLVIDNGNAGQDMQDLRDLRDALAKVVGP